MNVNRRHIVKHSELSAIGNTSDVVMGYVLSKELFVYILPNRTYEYFLDIAKQILKR